MNRDAAVQMDRLMAAFPNPAWLPETIEAYFERLEQLDPGIARIAIESLKDTCTRRPSIAELQAAARDAWRTLSNEQQRAALENRRLDDDTIDLRDPATAERMQARVREISKNLRVQVKDRDNPESLESALGRTLDEMAS